MSLLWLGLISNPFLMPLYRDIDGDSGVVRYESTPDSITVYFKDGSGYLYTNVSAGAHNIQRMKTLAMNRDGLNAFINKHVKKLYASKVC